ncbi:MAG: ATP-binding cassette domain-containing protein [Actinobacteria bacterium]|nr:ATP-binding cassette domain-containing protein [Actinomycetota bacterium]
MVDTAPVFDVKGVGYRYQDAEALSGVSFSVRPGERLALLGANGSGKSTLLKMLDGLIFPSAGSISAFGEELSETALRDDGFSQRFRRRVGFVFQNSDAQLFSPSVWEEIAFGPLHLGLDAAEVERRTEDTIHILGLGHLRERPPYHLSGGEKKKVALASVLAINPDVLLFDEPTAGLDPKTETFLSRLILQLAAAGKTIITATQDLGLVEDIAERIIILGEDHRIAGEGAPSQLLGDRGLLLSANLIHDHPHRHDGVEHYHPHSHLQDHHRHEQNGEDHHRKDLHEH